MPKFQPSPYLGQYLIFSQYNKKNLTKLSLTKTKPWFVKTYKMYFKIIRGEKKNSLND
jgi:hypothetical protein